MEFGLITFRSVTVAQRGEQALRGAGVRCSLRRTPGKYARQGCGYCLRLRQRDLVRAVAVLEEANIPLSGVYREAQE